MRKSILVFFLFSWTILLADSLSDSNRLFAWAERAYPAYFDSSQQTTEGSGYLYRYYPGTENYLGTKNGQVYVLGNVFDGLQEVGALSEFLDAITNAASETIADTVLIRGNIHTVDSENSRAEAIAVKNGSIIYIGSIEGSNAHINAQTEVINLEGKFVMPAFVDSHLHPLTNSYAALFQVALFDLDSADKYLEAITEFANRNPDEQWIVGAGFDAAAFDQLGPRKEVLDRILPDKAIAIVDRDIHSMLVNSRALELMGITRNTPDPDGGTIRRDANGDATGVLVDDSAMNLARDFFPLATKEQYKTSLVWMQEWLNREGITTAHDAWVEFDDNYYQAFDELAKEGKLTVRYRGSWFIDPNENYLRQINDGFEISELLTHPHFQVNSFKFLTDNVLELDTALLLDGSGVSGVRNWQRLWI
jgi:predicted amidohydrolase YtcJ